MMCALSKRGMVSPLSKMMVGIVAIALLVAMVPASALAVQTGSAELTATAVSDAPSAFAMQASKAAKNRAAHKAYKKKLKKLMAEGNAFGKYRFIDVTGDGVDEMITMWWPTVYTYKSGKVKKVFSGDVGRLMFQKAYKKEKTIVVTVNDPTYLIVSQSFLKWNGKKFVYKVTLSPASSYAKKQGISSRYYINGKGSVSEKTAKAYVKKLVGSAKATKITYKTL